MTITKAVNCRVILVVFQSQDLFDILNFHVLYDLVMAGFPHVEKLAPQGKDAIVVPPDYAETRDGQSLGGISFGQDERAVFCIPPASVVGILQFNNTGNSESVSAGLANNEGADRDRFVPSDFLRIWSCLNFAQLSTLSMIPDFETGNQHYTKWLPICAPFLTNSSESSHFEPKAELFSVNVSFVCESNAGFSIMALTKIHI